MIAGLGFGAMARKVFRKRLVRQIGTAFNVRPVSELCWSETDFTLSEEKVLPASDTYMTVVTNYTPSAQRRAMMSAMVFVGTAGEYSSGRFRAKILRTNARWADWAQQGPGCGI